MTLTRRLLPAGIVLAFVLTACGDSNSSSDETTESVAPTEVESTDPPPAETAPPETTPVETAPVATTPVETTPAETTPAETVPAGEGEIGAPAGGVAASLVEWGIDAPTEYAAGEVTFTATNNGNFPHEFVVIQGESYESLPRAEGGAVIEDELPTGALLGRTSRLGGGVSEDLTVTLAPGNYVLLCNLGSGGNSHAGRGQRLDITVS